MSAPDAVTQRKRRALLLERLLEGREWMMEKYEKSDDSNSSNSKGEKFTALARMLMMVAPTEVEKKGGKKETVFPEGYEENYKAAYRRCQDKPGGEYCLFYILHTIDIKISIFYPAKFSNCLYSI